MVRHNLRLPGAPVKRNVTYTLVTYTVTYTSTYGVFGVWSVTYTSQM